METNEINNLILVRYGELALKGNKRAQFEDRLIKNIKTMLHNISALRIERTFGRIYVEVRDEDQHEAMNGLKKVFGIVGLNRTKRVPLNIERIQSTALEMFNEISPTPQTFKVETRRILKSFPLDTPEINHSVGGYILKQCPELSVDVHHPQTRVGIEIRDTGAYIFVDAEPGPGGLPIGTGGKVMLMISGGLDSPVAGWQLMKRGVNIDLIHFHTPPYTSERAKQKVIDLTKVLATYGGALRLHIVPFTEIQTEIRNHCEESYLVTIMRRMMVRITEQIARKEGCLAIASGESLGQVASQTLESMNTINDVVHIPYFRPLLCMDKHEITAYAHAIGTYDISIQPFEDCCTIFLPRSPRTKPTTHVAEKLEQNLDLERLISSAIEGIESTWISNRGNDGEKNSYF